MKVTAKGRLVVEEFPEQKDWIGKVFAVINEFSQDVVRNLNGGLIFSENIAGVEKDFDFIYVSHAASLPLNLKWTLAKKPKAVQVVAAYEGAAASNKILVPIIVAVAWQYTQDGEVSITDFTKITGSTSTVGIPSVGQRILLRIRMTP